MKKAKLNELYEEPVEQYTIGVDRFKVVHRYVNNGKLFLIILDSQTGKVKTEIFDLDKDVGGSF
jgi:hypothetical protein